MAARNPETSGGRTEPIYATIHAVLRDHLMRAVLPPGLVLGEAAVARAFKVSRIPAGIALARLLEEGLIGTFDGRGYIVPGAPHGSDPLRIDLGDVGLELPAGPPASNRREQIYPEVEHAVAACLAYGRFMLNESALAEYYDVSRTVAHEVLTQLERAGVIGQDSNKRWYAGPLTAAEFAHHFEMRWLLEPQALRHAFANLARQDLQAKADRVKAARGPIPPSELEEIEADLHVRTLAPCGNTILLDTVRRSQRIILVTHSTFVNYQSRGEIEQMSAEHIQVYSALLAGDLELAASTLEAHLRRSLTPNLTMLAQLPAIPDALLPPYLLPAK